MPIDKREMSDIVFPSSDRSIRNVPLTKEPRRMPSPPRDNRFAPPRPTQPPRGGRGRRYALWVAAALSLGVLLFLLFSVLFDGATVRVMSRELTTIVNGTFSAKKNAGINEMPFELMSTSKDVTRTVVASGVERVEEKASGQITIYNDFSKASQKLVANTRFETQSGLIYRIEQPVTIPGQQTKDGKTVPGSVTVGVVADQPGDTYNIGLTDFTIPGFKSDPNRYQKFYARSKTPMTGGFSGTRPKLSAGDVAAAREAMRQELSALLLEDGNLEIPEGFILYPEGKFVVFEDLPNGTSASETSAEVRERGTLYAVLFDKEKLAQFIAQNSIADYDEGLVRLAEPESLSFAVANKANAKPWLDGAFSFTLSGSAKIIWTYDKTQFARDLADKEKAALQTVLTGYPGIESADVSMRPFWRNAFPTDPEKILVKDIEAE